MPVIVAALRSIGPKALKFVKLSSSKSVPPSIDSASPSMSEAVSIRKGALPAPDGVDPISAGHGVGSRRGEDQVGPRAGDDAVVSSVGVDEVIADPGVDGVGFDRDGCDLIVAGAGDEPVSSAMMKSRNDVPTILATTISPCPFRAHARRPSGPFE